MPVRCERTSIESASHTLVAIQVAYRTIEQEVVMAAADGGRSRANPVVVLVARFNVERRSKIRAVVLSQVCGTVRARVVQINAIDRQILAQGWIIKCGRRKAGGRIHLHGDQVSGVELPDPLHYRGHIRIARGTSQIVIAKHPDDVVIVAIALAQELAVGLELGRGTWGVAVSRA